MVVRVDVEAIAWRSVVVAVVGIAVVRSCGCVDRWTGVDIAVRDDRVIANESSRLWIRHELFHHLRETCLDAQRVCGDEVPGLEVSLIFLRGHLKNTAITVSTTS